MLLLGVIDGTVTKNSLCAWTMETSTTWTYIAEVAVGIMDGALSNLE
jgi:hypothetical protein